MAKNKIFRKHSLRAHDDQVTTASELSVRQSIFPIILVTSLYFLWVCLSESRPQRPRSTAPLPPFFAL